MTANEFWCVVPSLGDVLASSEGRVMRLPRLIACYHGGFRQIGGKPLPGQWDGERYIYLHSRRTYKVARLICEAFHGPPPQSWSVCMHLDENARNNRPENLAWGTQKQNLNAPGFIAYCQRCVGIHSPSYKARLRRAAAKKVEVQ